ncbi:hypothetical protein PMAYCL1PPCAC_20720, partial [Pristionchus mayeri]
EKARVHELEEILDKKPAVVDYSEKVKELEEEIDELTRTVARYEANNTRSNDSSKEEIEDNLLMDETAGFDASMEQFEQESQQNIEVAGDLTKVKKRKNIHDEINDEEKKEEEREMKKHKKEKNTVGEEKEDWIVSCICGATDEDGEKMVGCDECKVRWEHVDCIFPRTKKAPEVEYYCHLCKPRPTELTPEQARAYQDGVKEEKKRKREAKNEKQRMQRMKKKKEEEKAKKKGAGCSVSSATTEKKETAEEPPPELQHSEADESASDRKDESKAKEKTNGVRSWKFLSDSAIDTMDRVTPVLPIGMALASHQVRNFTRSESNEVRGKIRSAISVLRSVVDRMVGDDQREALRSLLASSIKKVDSILCRPVSHGKVSNVNENFFDGLNAIREWRKAAELVVEEYLTTPDGSNGEDRGRSKEEEMDE